MKKRFLSLVFFALCLFYFTSSLAEANNVILAVGGSFVYARDSQGVLRVWGDNQFGQLANGTIAQSKSVQEFKSRNPEIDVTKIKNIFAGCDYSYFLMEDGTIYGAGNNATNCLLYKGGRASTHVKLPLQDPGIIDIACGFGHTLILNDRGEVYAFGRNNCGQAGSGKSNQITQPVHVDLPYITQIAAGGKFSLALDRNGVLWGWGNNEFNQITPVASKAVFTPTKIDTKNIQIKMIDAGGSFVGIVDKSGKLYVWGVNDVYQLGFETNKQNVTEPTEVQGLPLPVKHLACYSGQGYVILEDGSVWSWGNNTYGQLGVGYRVGSGKGVMLSKVWEKGMVMIQPGSLFVTGMLEDGTLVSAGINKFGQLGYPTKSWTVNTLTPNGIDLLPDYNDTQE